ncbi:MAG: YihA family ribosome biogenesis GTP-binding protein [Hyphomonadaceae bacterium]|nr:YihA family ribosome biogenesis GTP-binding protein [Hyphomonadaceae bacterium]
MTPEQEAERIEAGRLLFAGPVTFELGVADMRQLPGTELPEVAFAGRSNVGKSSLVNAITGRKGLARASTEPGRTRELNYFRVGDRLRLVDLPGYGFAKAGKGDIKRWTALTRDFLRGRPNLMRVFLLIDSRHGLKEHDKEVMDELDKAAVTYQLVFTKSDKVKPTELAALTGQTAALIAKRPAAFPEIIATSSETGAGIEALRAEIAALA